MHMPQMSTPRIRENHTTSAETDYMLLSGNLNLILDPKLDCDNYKHINNLGARKELLEIIEKQNLCDAYRKLNPPKDKPGEERTQLNKHA